MKASGLHQKIQPNHNATQPRTMQGQGQQQNPKLASRTEQASVGDQFSRTQQQQTGSKGGLSGIGSEEIPQQFYTGYQQSPPYVQPLYFSQPYMMPPGMQQQQPGAVSSGPVNQGTTGQKQQGSPNQMPLKAHASSGQTAGKLQGTNGQPMGGNIPSRNIPAYMPGYARGPAITTYMPGYQYPVQQLHYSQNPYVSAQRTAPQVPQREKKVLKIIDPKTKEAVIPSKAPTNAGLVPEIAKDAKAVSTESSGKTEEENNKKELNSVPVKDARAELLAAAKCALESDKSTRKDIDDKTHPGSNSSTKVHETREKLVDAKKSKAPASKVTDIKKATDEESIARNEKTKAERKAKEEEARKVVLEKQMERTIMQEKIAKVKEERKKAEIEAKKKMEQKKQAKEKLERDVNNADALSALGNKIMEKSLNAPSGVVSLKKNGKVTYTISVLLEFKSKNKEVPQALSPNVIDMVNIKSVGPSPGRTQFSNQRDSRHGRHMPQPQRQNSGNAGGQWQRRQQSHGRANDARSRGPPRQASGLVVKALKKTENAWKPQQAKDEDEATLRSVTQVLNKISRDNFEKLTKKILDIKVTSLSVLEEVVKLIRNKALTEPKFGDLYADLCKVLKEQTEKSGYNAWSFIEIVEKDGKWHWTTSQKPEAEDYLKGPFSSKDDAEKNATKSSELRRILLNQCQTEFEEENKYEGLEKSKSELLQKLKSCKSDDEKQKVKEQIGEIDYKTSRLKQRILGNIQFIGELFKKQILTARVLMWCISHLISQDDEPKDETKVPDEENLECLCKLLTTVGKELDAKKQPETVAFISHLFGLLERYSVNKKLDARHRFMIKDVIELRSNNWQARREEVKAKKLEDIRKDAAMEEAAKRANSAAASQRGGPKHIRGANKGNSRNRNSEVIRSVVTNSGMSMGTGFKIGAGAGAGNGNQQESRNLSQDVRMQGAAQPRPSSRSSLQGRPSIGGATGGRPGGSRPGALRPGGQGSSSALGLGNRKRLGLGAQGNATSGGPAKPKQSMDPNEVKRLVENTLKEFLQVGLKKELLEYLQSMEAKVGDVRSLKNCVVETCISYASERKDKDFIGIVQALVTLLDEGFVAHENIKTAANEFLEFMPDIKIDVPLADKKVGQLFAELVILKKVDISQVPGYLKKLVEIDLKLAVKLSGAFLVHLLRKEDSAKIVKSMHISLASFLAAHVKDEMKPKYYEAVKEVIDRNGVLLQLSVDADPLEEELSSMITRNLEIDEILKWIQTNIHTAKMESKTFVKFVIVTVLEHVGKSAGTLNAKALKPPSRELDMEMENIKAYSRLMKRVANNTNERTVQQQIQVECLNGVAELSEKYGHAPGLAQRWFKELYDSEIIKEDSYTTWKMVCEKERIHKNALTDCAEWLNWLENAEEESM